ncbi:MAG: class I SAM-dependent methyltransferase [Tetrasphaera sp.]|nr:class I SAM-dependent methyltransferase [Tetrasphaera sp.]
MCFDDRAATWDDPDKVARSAEVADAIRRRLDLTARPRTLEIGAGTGLLSRALRADLGPTTLADSSPGMLAVAAQVIAEEHLDGWTTALADADDASLPGGPYELVLSQLALHHMEHPRAVIGRIHAVLAPGGHLAVADLDHDPEGAFHRAHGDFHGHHGFDRDHLARWLAEAGFTDVFVETVTMLTKEVEGEARAFPLFLATARRPA